MKIEVGTWTVELTPTQFVRLSQSGDLDAWIERGSLSPAEAIRLGKALVLAGESAGEPI